MPTKLEKALSSPAAVLISDLHFTVKTLDEASEALISAFELAAEKGVPLVIGGDTLDTKAVMRAECVNALLDIFQTYSGQVDVHLNIGNHDLINEKCYADFECSLRFLEPFCKTLGSGYVQLKGLKVYMMPYSSSAAEVLEVLDTRNHTKTIIAHTGVRTAYMGHYLRDSSSLEPSAFKDFRVISGHYHRAQDIVCGPISYGNIGLFSYIGSPYTVSFAEANDGPKGVQILYDNGHLELIPLNLRKHVVIEVEASKIKELIPSINLGDLVWVKVTGTRKELHIISSVDFAHLVDRASYFKLDKIYTDSTRSEIKTDKMSNVEVLDHIIDSLKDNQEQKNKLKNLWRELLEDN